MIRKEELDKILIDTFKKVKKTDSYLINNDIHEISLEFRFAHYLSDIIEKKYNYKVDIEYNRDRGNPKIVDTNVIRPDVIIHKRGSCGPNIAAIEIKKHEDSIEDKTKLLSIRDKYNYSYIYFVNFNSNVEYYDYNESSWVIIGGNDNE